MTAQQWHAAESLFHAALELPEADRSDWVTQACVDNPGLADQVLKMLSADAAPGNEIRLAVRSAIRQWAEK